MHRQEDSAATGSQLITEARRALRARRREEAQELTASLVPFAAPLPTAELERLADLCEELAMIPEEIEVRTLLVSRQHTRRADWKRLARLHGKLGDRRAAARCRQRAAGVGADQDDSEAPKRVGGGVHLRGAALFAITWWVLSGV